MNKKYFVAFIYSSINIDIMKNKICKDKLNNI